ncbi:MAG: hypothetical protein MJE68_29670 [Proteobacteria bacterium]|nr:hypothetical protein [Pseudomonadota bacterium]
MACISLYSFRPIVGNPAVALIQTEMVGAKRERERGERVGGAEIKVLTLSIEY